MDCGCLVDVDGSEVKIIRHCGLLSAMPTCSHEWGSVEDAHEENRPVYCLKCGANGDA